MSRRSRVLVADDEASIRFVLRETLEAEGFEVTEAEDGDAAFEALSSRSFDVAFLDIRMPGPSGLEILDRQRVAAPATLIVIITAQNTFENAVEAMKRGAFDYLVKPFGIDEVLAVVAKATRAQELESEVRSLRRAVGATLVPGERLIGRSPELLEVFKTIGRVARTDVSVLITGESGTGKELVARAIHNAGPRSDRPFVPVNAAAIPKELLESELFGHERGAFTGAVEARAGRFREASGGTLFFDEIGDMPLELQAKLLRVLQSGEVTPVGGRRAESVDVRILAATHRDLDEAVASGAFREDLLYRLRVVPMALPPLRQRGGDVRALAEHFVERYADQLVGEARHLSEDALDFLEEYPWPGNVRELENAVKRAIVLTGSDVLTRDDFSFLSTSAGHAAPEAPGLEELVRDEANRALASGKEESLHQTMMARVERPLLEAVLRHTGGNQIRAAAVLGINRNTLRKKIATLEIEVRARS